MRRPPGRGRRARPTGSAERLDAVGELSGEREDDVAAGDGAFRTWRTPPLSATTKSSTRSPARETACARTPALARSSTSATPRPGMYSAHAATNAARLAAMRASRSPVRQKRRATRHVPGQPSALATSRGRTVRRL